VEHIGEIEKRLWSSADTLRANSNFASNEYFLPVMGLIFLRHAYSRFLSAKMEISRRQAGGRHHAPFRWTGRRCRRGALPPVQTALLPDHDGGKRFPH
jgi:hypothetical protein